MIAFPLMNEPISTVIANAIVIAWDYLERTGELGDAVVAGRVQGEFKQSSQHSEVGGCDEHCKAAIDAVRTSLITIAGTTACGGTG